MCLMDERFYKTDSYISSPVGSDGLSTYKCTAQREGEDAADSILYQGSFQSGGRAKIWTRAKISNVVRQSMTSVKGVAW